MEKHKKFVIAGILFCTALVIVFSLIGSKLTQADPTTPPNARILSYSHIDFTNDKLYFDIYDNSGSGLAGVQLFSDGVYVMDIDSPYDVATYDTSALAEGTYQLEAVATDAAGNVATSSPYAITIDHTPPPLPPDTAAPNVTILSIADNKIYTDIYDTGGSGIASVQLYIDNVLSQTITPPAAYDLITVDTGALSSGDHQIVVSAVDVAGNWATSSANQLTVIDSTAPETADNVPVGSQTESAVVTFACADSGSGCQKTFYTTNGVDPDTASSFVNSSSSWQFSISSIGSYAIKYRSIDNAGNLEAVKTAANPLIIVARAPYGGGSSGEYVPPATTTEIITATTTSIATTTEIATTTATTTEAIAPIITTEAVIEVPAASLVEVKEVQQTITTPPAETPSVPVAETAAVPVVEVVANAGVKLFDIMLGIQNALLNKSRDLISEMQFINFGNVPTIVHLDYMIMDASGGIVYDETDEVTVETEQVVTRNFKDLNLADGKYTLVVTTIYSDQVTDEFRQNFEIRGASILKYGTLVRVLAILIIIIIAIVAIMFGLFKFVRHKKKINKLNI